MSSDHADHTVPDRAAWLSEAGFGLFVHWHENSMPAVGEQLPYADAVDRFPVQAFADQTAEAGAGYVIFTITHVLNYLPFPLPAMDKLLPGRTCSRDLMAELAEALAERGIRFLFYHSWQANGDPELAEIAGWQRDLARWQATMADLAAAIGERYGNRLAGWWIDNCRPDKWDEFMAGYDFPAMAEALRTGNPDRAVAFNVSGPAPPVPPRFDHRLAGIADYVAGHLHDELLVAEGPFDGNGLRSHWCNNMDTRPKWFFNGDNRQVRFSDEAVIACVNGNLANGAAFTYNIGPSQEGLIDPATMAQLRAVRDAR